MTIHVDIQDRLLIGQYGLTETATGKIKMENGTLLVLSKDFAELGRYPTDLCPLTVFASKDGTRAYASNIYSGTVTVIDLASKTGVRTFDVDLIVPQGKKQCQGAHGLALIP